MAQILTGIVVSNKPLNTIVLEVETKKTHSMYKKVIKMTKRIMAHTGEDSKPKVGDVVSVVSCKPRSKNKSFELKKS
jgi:small subunit ribosomal protein S17